MSNSITTKRGLKYDFTLIAILLIPIGVAINFVGAQIVLLLKLPVFLDTIGTALAAMIGGPWIGMLTGALTNIVKGITNPVSFTFIPVQVAIGLVVGILSKNGMFNKIWKIIISAILIALAATLVATPIQVIVFGGATGNSSDILVATLLTSGQEIWASVFSTKILIETFDKILCLLVAYFIIRNMSPRYLSKLNYGSDLIKIKEKKAS